MQSAMLLVDHVFSRSTTRYNTSRAISDRHLLHALLVGNPLQSTAWYTRASAKLQQVDLETCFKISLTNMETNHYRFAMRQYARTRERSTSQDHPP